MPFPALLLPTTGSVLHPKELVFVSCTLFHPASPAADNSQVEKSVVFSSVNAAGGGCGGGGGAESFGGLT